MASVKSMLGVVVAGSMFVSSTASVAATSLPATQINPWASLTAMSAGAPAATMCGAAASAAQGAGGCVLPAVDAPPPMASAGEALPPVAATASQIANVYPLLLALAVLAAAAGIYGLTKAYGKLGPVPVPNSPA